MREFLISLDRTAPKSLQAQLREVMVTAILTGHLQAGEKLPSTRHLAKQLGVSRNTAILVYMGLVDDGYLRTAERSGYFVNETVLEMGIHNSAAQSVEPVASSAGLDWRKRLKKTPTSQANITKPPGWQKLKHPFIFGQPDLSLFPITDWRDCVYKSMGRKWLDDWSQDTLGADDPLLIEQIRTRILPRRGILARDDEILVTLGAQHAIYMVASLLASGDTRVGMEEPGYPDARNIFALRTDHVLPIPVDQGGLVVDERLEGVDLVYTTPSHQLPTTVTMPSARRKALLDMADAHDFVIIEDDYELETNFSGKPEAALKSIDRDGRVIYIGSFSKTLFPGLRLGFVVASADFIAELRALRRLMVRHPPTNNQRSTAFFLSLGYYDVFARRLNRVYRERWDELERCMKLHLPEVAFNRGTGGSAFWLTLPPGCDAERLRHQALEASVLVEPGNIYFASPGDAQHIRLGFSSIATEAIEPGIEKLAELIGKLSS